MCSLPAGYWSERGTYPGRSLPGFNRQPFRGLELGCAVQLAIITARGNNPVCSSLVREYCNAQPGECCRLCDSISCWWIRLLTKLSGYSRALDPPPKISPVKVVVIFLTIFSLALLFGPARVSSSLSSPLLPLATPQVGPCGPGPGACACLNAQGAGGYCWLPAGPSMDTEQALIFTDQSAELTDIQSSSPHIDLTDSPLPSSLIYTFTTSSQLGITSGVADHGYMEIEFNLADY